MVSKKKERKELILKAIRAWTYMVFEMERDRCVTEAIEIFAGDGYISPEDGVDDYIDSNIASLSTKKLKKFLKICELLGWKDGKE